VLHVLPTRFPEAKVFVPDVYADERGFFKEVWSRPKYAAVFGDIPQVWDQDSVSRSRRGVLRGMHYDFRMAKLVQCLAGEIFDCIVDLRRESPAYLQWEGFHLSAGNHRQLFVPAGFGHGFLALADDVVVHYKNSVPFDAASEGAVSWRNPRIGIDWPLNGEAPLLSAKDAAVPLDALP
jgi:dTDP-4-dehydrorhamnose 3,5-epimerase